MPALTPEQAAFLASKRVPLSKVFDADGMSKTEYQEAMRPLGYWIAFNVTPCREAGHRLRTRAGHCAQCDPAKISFTARHDKAASVYVAHSARRHFTKVGSAEDVTVRIASLNSHRYAQIDDWKLVFHAPCTRSGEIEFQVHAQLAEHYLPRANAQGANSAQSQELFACEPAVAVEAVKKVLASATKTRA
jgi:hypothetical protein